MRKSIFILFMILVAGCAPQATPTQVAAPSSVPCFPNSVFTAEEMRVRVNCHPDEYKLEIDNETVVLFAFPDPLLDWVGPVFVIHVPSVSEAVLDTEGTIIFNDYKSLEGQNAIEAVLNHPELFAQILERANAIER